MYPTSIVVDIFVAIESENEILFKGSFQLEPEKPIVCTAAGELWDLAKPAIDVTRFDRPESAPHAKVAANASLKKATRRIMGIIIMRLLVEYSTQHLHTMMISVWIN